MTALIKRDTPTLDSLQRWYPIGSYTISRVDPAAPNLKLLQQDYVMQQDFLYTPTLGCTHHTESDALLINSTDSTPIGGGLQRMTATFVIGAPATFERDTTRTYTFPGIKIPEIIAQETYIQITTREVENWVPQYFDMTVQNVDGDSDVMRLTTFQKSEEEEKEREISVQDVVLREPKSLTISATEKVTYASIANPAGVSITGSPHPIPTIRNGYSRIVESFGTPRPKEAFVVYGNARETARRKIETELQKKQHPNSLEINFTLPSLGTSLEISSYLTQESTPSIEDYFELEKIFMEATSVNQVNGSLYKYSDIYTAPL